MSVSLKKGWEGYILLNKRITRSLTDIHTYLTITTTTTTHRDFYFLSEKVPSVKKMGLYALMYSARINILICYKDDQSLSTSLIHYENIHWPFEGFQVQLPHLFHCPHSVFLKFQKWIMFKVSHVNMWNIVLLCVNFASKHSNR